MSTKLRRRWGRFFLVAIAFALLTGASSPHNSLVVRTAETQGSVPSDCEQGLSEAPLPPRVDVSRIALPETMTQSPGASLPSESEALHRALLENDRSSFDGHLAGVRAVLASTPAGAEKSAVEELVRIYSDVARIWDAQFVLPFFDEESAEFAILKQYPGYDEAVRRGILTDDRDRRFYPATESRVFLTGLAAERIARMGIDLKRPEPPRVVLAEVEVQPSWKTQQATTPAPRRTTTTQATTQANSKPRRATSSVAAPARKPTRKRALASTTAVKTEKVSSPPVAAPPVVAPPVDITPAPVATTSTEPMSVPVTETTPSTETATTALSDTALMTTSDVTDFVTTTTTATASETTASAAEAVPAAPASSRRSMALPLILILVGVGVLLLLFRASN